MNRIQDESAIVLHTRAYRESSLIVQFLTARHGRIAAVAKGVRGRRRGHGLQPFYQGLLNCSGRGALASLHRFELAESRWFTGNGLALASYVGELVMRLTKEWEPAPRLFDGVAWALERLGAVNSAAEAECCLRRFEKLLLEELGYGLDFSRDAGDGAALQPDGRYELLPESGFVCAAGEQGYSGEALLAIAEERFDGAPARRAAKSIFRALLAPHLGPAPLLSRQLYRREGPTGDAGRSEAPSAGSPQAPNCGRRSG